MKLKVYPDYPLLSRAVADLIGDYVKNKKNALICIASGHTPVGVFECLIKDIKSGVRDISLCTFISLDEWIGIDPSDPGSCLSMLKKDFFDPLGINGKQLVFFDVKADLQKECDRINDFISSQGGLDVMLVGLGTNGHIGMNEPGTPFDLYAHIGELVEETKEVGQKYFKSATLLSSGITLGLKHLKEARLPIVMASGEKKAAIINKLLNSKPTEQIPATIIHQIPQGYMMVDDLAAAKWEKAN
jgi:glucosamine-6-phosphate deaminase